MSSPGIPRTVALDRALDVLSSVAESVEPASASALSRSTGQPRATVSRTLRTFADRGLVAETPAGWVIGNEMFRLARTADPHSALIEAADGPLRRLRDRTEESALFAIVKGRIGMEIVTQLDAAHRLGVVGWVGADIPLHASSAGKLVLAELNESELVMWFDEAQPARLTPRTVTTVSGLASELRRVRRRGWADIVDELEEGLMSLSAPIRDRAGSLVAMIGISGPGSRLSAARRRQLVPFVLKAATEAQQALVPAAGGVMVEPTSTRLGLTRSPTLSV
jgi:IclR family transcriptional regulator, acetate operon repressor